MLYYNQTDVYEAIYINKTNDSSEYKICFCYYLFDIHRNFQPCQYDGCRDLF